MKKYLEVINKYGDNIAIGLFIAMIAMQLSLTKILAPIVPIFNYSYNPPILCIIYVLIIGLIYALVLIPRIFIGNECIDEKEEALTAPMDRIKKLVGDYKWLIVILALLLIAIVATDVITIMKGALRITNIFTHNLDYLYAFLALPIAILLTEKKLKWETLANVILALTAASAAMRAFVSIYYSLTGIEIEIISKESAGLFWFRNNRLRVTAPCLMNLFFAIAVYMIYYTKSLVKRFVYIVETLVVLLYGYFIWQTRAGLAIVIGGSVVVVLFGVMTKKQFKIRWGIVAVLFAVFVALGGIQKLLLAFSTADNAQFVMENRGHYNAYALFWGILKDNPFGTGLSETLAVWYPNGRALWMCDAGIMYSLVPMGIFIAVFFVVMIARGIAVYITNMRTNKMASLILALTLIIGAGELAMDCFFTPLAFAMPIYLALVEYVAHRNDDSLEM